MVVGGRGPNKCVTKSGNKLCSARKLIRGRTQTFLTQSSLFQAFATLFIFHFYCKHHFCSLGATYSSVGKSFPGKNDSFVKFKEWYFPVRIVMFWFCPKNSWNEILDPAGDWLIPCRQVEPTLFNTALAVCTAACGEQFSIFNFENFQLWAKIETGAKVHFTARERSINRNECCYFSRFSSIWKNVLQESLGLFPASFSWWLLFKRVDRRSAFSGLQGCKKYLSHHTSWYPHQKHLSSSGGVESI